MSHNRILEAIADLFSEHSIYDAHHEEDSDELYDPEHDTSYEIILKPLD